MISSNRRSLVAAFFLGLLLGYLTCWGTTGPGRANIVAMSWGDGKYGEAYYGAEVYLVKMKINYSVRGRVWIGRDDAYYHDIGELGVVRSQPEATAKWGQLGWSDAGLTIGPGDPKPVFLEREKLEAHR
jgi:hypothetical protein